MKYEPDLSILSTGIQKNGYANQYVEVALETQFKDSYMVLNSIYYLGRWYATKKTLKAYFEINNTALDRLLTPLKRFGLIEYHKTNTSLSYVKLTNEGASVVAKKRIRWDKTKCDIHSLLDKSDMLYQLDSNKEYNTDFLYKKECRNDIIIGMFNFRGKEYPRIETLEQNHIYLVNCSCKEITFALKYTNTEDYFKDCAKAFNYISRYTNINDIKINILLLAKNEINALNTIDIVEKDDFRRSERSKLKYYLGTKRLDISFEEFINRISKSTTILTY